MVPYKDFPFGIKPIRGTLQSIERWMTKNSVEYFKNDQFYYFKTKLDSIKFSICFQHRYCLHNCHFSSFTIVSNLLEITPMRDWCKEQWGPPIQFDNKQNIVREGRWDYFNFDPTLGFFIFRFRYSEDMTLFNLWFK